MIKAVSWEVRLSVCSCKILFRCFFSDALVSMETSSQIPPSFLFADSWSEAPSLGHHQCLVCFCRKDCLCGPHFCWQLYAFKLFNACVSLPSRSVLAFKSSPRFAKRIQDFFPTLGVMNRALSWENLKLVRQMNRIYLSTAYIIVILGLLWWVFHRIN